MLEFYLLLLGAVFLFSLVGGLTAKIKESTYNANLRLKLNKQATDANSRENYLQGRDQAFRQGFLSGRQWLAGLVADAEAALDATTEEHLRTKKHPAIKAAETVSEIRREKRELKAWVKLLEYQLKSYEEYFPFLEEYRDLILDERITLSGDQDNVEEIEAADPTLQFLTREEYDRLPSAERNQLALSRYIARAKNNWEIGRLYERYLGYLRETTGWRVEFHGAIRGFDDFGRDLICRLGNNTEIVQAKCWSRHKVIHEKHVFQLYGTCVHFRLSNPSSPVTAVFATTTELSEAARVVADVLNVRVEKIQLPPVYPMIKCNVNGSTKERIYHLPFDQQYDRTVIGTVPGECYLQTVAEAEKLGFRRAWRYLGWQTPASGLSR